MENKANYASTISSSSEKERTHESNEQQEKLLCPIEEVDEELQSKSTFVGLRQTNQSTTTNTI